MPALRGVAVGDDPTSWTSAGFALDGSALLLGEVVVELRGADGPRGILGLDVEGLGPGCDELAQVACSFTPEALPHPNGATAIDHLVVTTPDADRTTEALVAAGLDVRRVRTFAVGDQLRRQTFFWMGDVILELVGPDEASGSGPAELWGLALTTRDLDAAVTSLGDAIGSPRDAVQPGRRIATLRHEAIGMSVSIAFMTPHPRRAR